MNLLGIVTCQPNAPPKPLKTVHPQLRALFGGEQPACQAAAKREIRKAKFLECCPYVTGKFVGIVLLNCQRNKVTWIPVLRLAIPALFTEKSANKNMKISKGYLQRTTCGHKVWRVLRYIQFQIAIKSHFTLNNAIITTLN